MCSMSSTRYVQYTLNIHHYQQTRCLARFVLKRSHFNTVQASCCVLFGHNDLGQVASPDPLCVFVFMHRYIQLNILDSRNCRRMRCHLGAVATDCQQNGYQTISPQRSSIFNTINKALWDLFWLTHHQSQIAKCVCLRNLRSCIFTHQINIRATGWLHHIATNLSTSDNLHSFNIDLTLDAAV